MHKVSTKGKEKKIIISILLNILITVSQIFGGVVSGSIALISDAMHNLSDAASLVVTYIGVKLSRRKNTLTKTYGYQRAEIISALINAVLLMVVAIFLFKEAIERLNEPQELIKSVWVMGLGGFSIVMNAVCVVLLHNDSHGNMNMKSAYIHLFTDMLTSVAVVLGGVLMYFYGIYWVDALLCLLISLYLAYMSFDLLKESVEVLMLFAPKGYNVNAITSRLNEIQGVQNVHHVHIWKLNDDSIHFQAHIDFKEDIKLSQFVAELDTLKIILQKEFKIDHVILQPEYGYEDNKSVIVQDFHQ